MTAELTEDVTLRMPRWRDWTYADLQDLPDDGRRYEIVDGSLHVSPSPSRPHQVAAGRLRDMLLRSAPEHAEVVETVDIDLGPSVVEPDVVVMDASVAHTHGGPLTARHVLLVVEVVSPSSRRMDRLVKPSVLAEGGVPAYWRVEIDGPGTPMVAVYALDGDAYREVVMVHAGEIATVEVPYPVEVRPANLIGPRAPR